MHEIALPGEDEPPVRHIGQRRKSITSKCREGVRLGEPLGVDRHQEQEEEETRQETPCPSLVEAEERHGAGSAPLGHEQRRDEVAGEHEEDVHAEEAATEPGHPGMESEDTDHRDGTDAIESRHVLSWGAGGRADFEVADERWNDAALLGRLFRRVFGREFRCRHGR